MCACSCRKVTEPEEGKLIKLTATIDGGGLWVLIIVASNNIAYVLFWLKWAFKLVLLTKCCNYQAMKHRLLNLYMALPNSILDVVFFLLSNLGSRLEKNSAFPYVFFKESSTEKMMMQLLDYIEIMWFSKHLWRIYLWRIYYLCYYYVKLLFLTFLSLLLYFYYHSGTSATEIIITKSQNTIGLSETRMWDCQLASDHFDHPQLEGRVV